MAKLDLAAQRLGAALDALEKATVPLLKARQDAAGTAKRIDELTEERERHLARIATLEEDARSLSGLTEEVEDKLDGAIAEIRAALGR